MQKAMHETTKEKVFVIEANEHRAIIMRLVNGEPETEKLDARFFWDNYYFIDTEGDNE